MSAADTIESLLKLGVAVKDAFSAAQQANGAAGWTAFLSSAQFKDVEGDVQGLVANLTKSDLDAAIAALHQKETALLGGQAVSQLPADKLLQYSDLLDTETALVNRKVSTMSTSADALSWIVDDLLPVLVSTAKVIIPLLV